MARIRVDFYLQIVRAGIAQCIGQYLQTLTLADWITFAADHQQGQVVVDLHQPAVWRDVLQALEQVDP